MAVSETAFLSLKKNRLRWFTPDKEVSLCGHATLATIHILRELNLLEEGVKTGFETLSGTLYGLFQGSQIELNFPLLHVEPVPVETLGLKIAALHLSDSDIEMAGRFSEGKDFIVLSDESKLIGLQPNFSQLGDIPGRGIVVTTSTQNPEFDFLTRYFAPWVGVNEDPVTGSAFCALADYWGKRLNQTRLVGYQASSRGGRVVVSVLPNQRVILAGNAVTVLRGHFDLN
ncbi:MAG: putative isomerase YddE [Candidatus Celerinatantimonas neptuna]|nr:MAG: putative isomerase YddE [Candidatus Celerinatantimonas neptuna]